MDYRIFSELYSAYYCVIAEIIKELIKKPISEKEIQNIISMYAFDESYYLIMEKIKKNDWKIIGLNSDDKSYNSYIHNTPIIPLTSLQKRWLKSVSLDKRIKLFTDDVLELDEVEPLFTDENIIIFDKYKDGDDYENEGYISRFRLILDAIHNEYPLKISIKNKEIKEEIILPRELEYSEKDDKFRLIIFENVGKRKKKTIMSKRNLSNIIACSKYEGEFIIENVVKEVEQLCVKFKLKDERNSLERVLMHFAHFKKEVVKEEVDVYKVIMYYDKEDRTEVLIRLLSFGPFIKVIGPDDFVNDIRDRIDKQIKLLQN